MNLPEGMFDEDMLMLDGFDSAIMGVGQVEGKDVLIYDRDVIQQKLEDDGMTEDEASEFIDFNIVGAYMGPNTPIVMWPMKSLCGL